MNTQNAKGRLRDSVKDLLENGQVGDWCFRGSQSEDDAYLCVLIPDGTESGDLAMLPLAQAERPRWNWDGNKEAPTLTPSILHHGMEDEWHGFMTKGELISC